VVRVSRPDCVAKDINRLPARSPMNGLGRMLTALDLREPDRIPIWELIINEPVIAALAGSVSKEDFYESEGLDGISVFEDVRRVQVIDPATYRDEWGILWRIEPSGLAYPSGGPIKLPEDLDTYSPPDPDAEHRLQSLERAVKRFKGTRAVVFACHEGFEFSHYLRGMRRLLLDYYRNPRLARRLARIVTDYKKKVIARAIDLGADVVLTGDDYCNRNGPLMSVAHFEKFVLPYLRETVAVARRRGIPYIKHTDGNIWPIFEQLVNAGITAIDPLEPAAGMDIGEVKERYGDRICLIGNIDCGELLSWRFPRDVADSVRETVARAGPGGGYILSSSNSIHPAVKPENYRAMVQAARRYGKYA